MVAQPKRFSQSIVMIGALSGDFPPWLSGWRSGWPSRPECRSLGALWRGVELDLGVIFKPHRREVVSMRLSLLAGRRPDDDRQSARKPG